MPVETFNFDLRAWHLGSNQTLWRYVDLETLIRLMATFDRSTGLADLFFPRLDHLRLSDPSEGRFPRDVAKLQAKSAQSTQESPTLTPEQKQAFLTQRSRLESDGEYRESVFPDDSLPALFNSLATTTDWGVARFGDLFLGRLHYVSCWHLAHVESHAMWRIYSKGRGVAVKTTVGRLERSLVPNQGTAYVGRVQYSTSATQAKWPTEILTLGYLPFAFWKRLPFAYEKEVRVVIPQGLSESFFDADEVGRTVPVRLRDLITEIVVSPFGEPDLTEVVRATVDRFIPQLRVRPSTLLDLPPYASA